MFDRVPKNQSKGNQKNKYRTWNRRKRIIRYSSLALKKVFFHVKVAREKVCTDQISNGCNVFHVLIIKRNEEQSINQKYK